MANSDVVLKEYTDKTLYHNTPIKKEFVTELRDNIQIAVTALDVHSGATGDHEHTRVTSTENGFFYPELLDLISKYIKDLDDIEDMVKEDDFPPYSIAIWSGELGNVPSNWAICDGSNGTPDLRQRIAVCWDGARPIGQEGGSFVHSVSSASLMHNHVHKFHNIVGVYSNNGGYEAYKKFGQWKGKEIFPTDTGGQMYCFKEDSSETGTANQAMIQFNVITPYVCKYYIMRLPTSQTEQQEMYTVLLENDEGTIIQSNLGGPGTYKVRKGAQLILSMSVDNPEAYIADGIYINDTRSSEDVIMYVYEDMKVVSRAKKTMT